MSAYIVNREVIGNIVAHACRLGLSWNHAGVVHHLAAGNLPRAVEVGRMLWAENIRSVEGRYPDKLNNLPGPSDHDYEFRLEDVRIDDSQLGTSWSIYDGKSPLHVAINCLRYQSCEHDDWDTSEACAFLQALEDATKPAPVVLEPRPISAPHVRRFVESARVQRFGRGGSSIRSPREPLTDDQIRAVAPSVFAVAAHGSRSARYSYIPTAEVLAGLRREGFQPYAVNQGGSSDQDKRQFTKHMIRLRHASNLGAAAGAQFPEIVLINSHDGTSSYQLMAGIFRLVCSNGMIVGEGEIQQVRVTHTGNVVPKVIEGANQILQQLPQASESVRQWESLRLTEGERLAFASAALAARYDDDLRPDIQPERLLRARRSEDSDPTLWNTLNTVQENTIRGGIGYVARGDNGSSFRKTREVRGIDQDVRLNRALWTLAAEMQRLKAPAAGVV